MGVLRINMENLRAVKVISFIGAFLCAIGSVRAQSEMPDSLSASPDMLPVSEGILSPGHVKEYGGFLLDMNLMGTGMPREFPRFKIEVPDASKDYNRLFRLNRDVTYSSGLTNLFSQPGWHYLGSNPFGLTGFGFGDAADNIQVGSFRLKNGWQVNTYGEYGKDGRHVPNPSALPWQRNNFKGAFELKSQDGSFGIRIEVQHGRRSPF